MRHAAAAWTRTAATSTSIPAAEPRQLAPGGIPRSAPARGRAPAHGQHDRRARRRPVVATPSTTRSSATPATAPTTSCGRSPAPCAGPAAPVPGYWIADSRKMAYKARFRPLQVLTGNHWHAFETSPPRPRKPPRRCRPPPGLSLGPAWAASTAALRAGQPLQCRPGPDFRAALPAACPRAQRALPPVSSRPVLDGCRGRPPFHAEQPAARAPHGPGRLHRQPHRRRSAHGHGVRFPNPVGLAAGGQGRCLHRRPRRARLRLSRWARSRRGRSRQPAPAHVPAAAGGCADHRMGFNNGGVDAFVAMCGRPLEGRGRPGAEHRKNADTPIERANDDYLYCWSASIRTPAM
ncbi:protein of unknown function [Cupriavidus taiwanensis]|nr:protein of unknown function [Cupriavidus taiwanensis]